MITDLASLTSMDGAQSGSRGVDDAAPDMEHGETNPLTKKFYSFPLTRACQASPIPLMRENIPANPMMHSTNAKREEIVDQALLRGLMSETVDRASSGLQGPTTSQ